MWGIAFAVALGLFAQIAPGGGPGHGPRVRHDLGEVKLSDPTVKSATGKVDRMIVKRYLRRDLPKYRYCYERTLAAQPDLRGTLLVTFVLRTDGTVTSVRVEGVHDDIENCVAGLVRRLQLPKVPEEATVRTKVTLKRMAAPPPTRRGGSCLGLGCGTLG